jgi:hypothetical protein
MHSTLPVTALYLLAQRLARRRGGKASNKTLGYTTTNELMSPAGQRYPASQHERPTQDRTQSSLRIAYPLVTVSVVQLTSSPAKLMS